MIKGGVIMGFQNITSDFKKQITNLVYSKSTNNAFILAKEEQQEILKLIKELYSSLKEKIAEVDNFNDKYIAKKQQNIKVFTSITQNRDNITSENKANIIKTNSALIKEYTSLEKTARDDLENSISILENKLNKQLDLYEEELKIIEAASQYNENYYNDLYQKTETKYAENIKKNVSQTNENLKRLHSKNSLKTILFSEALNEDIRNVEEKIKEIEEKIAGLEADLDAQAEHLRAKILEESVTLNNLIRERNTNRNLTLTENKENTSIKQDDINNQKQALQLRYNEKNRQITEELISALKTIDDESLLIEKNHTNDIERFTRNYYYQYYQKLRELNTFIYNLKNKDTSSNLGIFMNNKRLIKLKVRSYKEELRELTDNYERQIKAYNMAYETNLNRIKTSKNLAEINRNYSAKVLEIEYKSQIASFNELSKLLSEELNLNNNSVNAQFNIDANELRNNSFINTEKLQNKLYAITTKYKLQIENEKKELGILKYNLEFLKNKGVFRKDNNDRIYLTESQLEKVISNLELDKNKLLNIYNSKRAKYRIDLVRNKAELQRKLIREQKYYDYQMFDLEKIKLRLKTGLELERLSKKIQDTKNLISKQIWLEDLQHNRDLNIATISHLRKDFRYDNLFLTKGGTSFFAALDDLNTFVVQVHNLLRYALIRFNANYLAFLARFTIIVQKFFSNFLNSFYAAEKNSILSRLESISKTTYSNLENEITNKYNEAKLNVQNKITSLRQTISKYDKTIVQFEFEISTKKNLLTKLSAEKSFLSRVVDLKIYQEKSEIKAKVKSLAIVKRKKKRLLDLLKKQTRLLTKLRAKKKSELRLLDERKREEYRSYYIFLRQTDKLKDKFIKVYSNDLEINPKNLVRYNYDKNITKKNNELSITLQKFINYYNLVFTEFKETNEDDFLLKINQVKLKFNHEVAKNKKFFRSKKHESTTNHNRVLKQIHLKIREINKEITAKTIIYNDNIRYNHKETYQKETQIQEEFKTITSEFNSSIHAISNNVVYLIMESNKKIKSYNNDYAVELATLNQDKYQNQQKLIFDYALYKARKNSDLSRLPKEEKATIGELNRSLSNKNAYYINEKSSLKKETIKNRKNYYLKRAEIASDSQNKLINERIIHNKKIKKVTK